MRRQVIKVLGAVTGHACRRPIYTLVVTALVAATTYLNVLEGSLLAASIDLSPKTYAGNLEVQPFLLGSRRLRPGEDSS
jgi:hydroxymethylglutaryl-CoA reductase (NADPH)